MRDRLLAVRGAKANSKKSTGSNFQSKYRLKYPKTIKQKNFAKNTINLNNGASPNHNSPIPLLPNPFKQKVRSCK